MTNPNPRPEPPSSELPPTHRRRYTTLQPSHHPWTPLSRTTGNPSVHQTVPIPVSLPWTRKTSRKRKPFYTFGTSTNTSLSFRGLPSRPDYLYPPSTPRDCPFLPNRSSCLLLCQRPPTSPEREHRPLKTLGSLLQSQPKLPEIQTTSIKNPFSSPRLKEGSRSPSSQMKSSPYLKPCS